MSTIQVKPHPDLDPAAWPLIVHPVSGSLLDAAKKVPEDGRPWLHDGFTCRMLTDGAILRADDPAFDSDPAPEVPPAPRPSPVATKPPPPPPSIAAKADPAS